MSKEIYLFCYTVYTRETELDKLALMAVMYSYLN